MSIPDVSNPVPATSPAGSNPVIERSSRGLDDRPLEDWFLVDDGRFESIVAHDGEPRSIDAIVAAVLQHLG